MKPKTKKTVRVRCWVTAVAALGAGLVNGIIGTGGGIILAYVFAYLSKNEDGDAKDHLACAMAVTLPVSLISLFTYDAGYFKSFSHFAATAVPASAGGVLGAVLSDRVKAELIKKVFAVLVIYSGITMVF